LKEKYMKKSIVLMSLLFFCCSRVVNSMDGSEPPVYEGDSGLSEALSRDDEEREPLLKDYEGNDVMDRGGEPESCSTFQKIAIVGASVFNAAGLAGCITCLVLTAHC
jgi:hypothetical protein